MLDGTRDRHGTNGGGAAHRRRVHWRRRIVVALVGLLVLGVCAVGGVYAYAQYRFHQIHREAVPGLAPIKAAPGHSADAAPYTILLVGDNCRSCLGPQKVFGSAAAIAGGRSDVTMLLRVEPASGRVSILSIPRDLWLPVPNTTGEIRVDAALNNGPGALVTTIEDALNIPINHYIELNFDTFQDIVNAIGGIDMAFPERAYDAYSKLNVPQGCYHLDGFQALEVVRARHFYYRTDQGWQYDGLGDISRIQRDHEFLRVLAKAVSAQGLGNPVTDNKLVGVVAKDLTIDNRFSLSDLLDLASTLSDVDLGTAPQTTLPVDEDNSPNGFEFVGEQYGDVVFPTFSGDHAAITAFLRQPLTGSTLPAGGTPVTIVNGSGAAGQATQVAARLRALGFPVSATATGPVNSVPAETVVYYAPGDEPAAQRLADDLGGAVALGQDASMARHGLTLVTGTNLTVAVPTDGAPRTSGVSRTVAPAAPAAPAAPVIGGVTATNPRYPAFDPRGCAAGVPATTLPALPVPATSVLPQT